MKLKHRVRILEDKMLAHEARSKLMQQVILPLLLTLAGVVIALVVALR